MVDTRRVRRIPWLLSAAVGLLVAVAALAYQRQYQDPAASFARGLRAIPSRDTSGLARETQILRRYPAYRPQLQLLQGVIALAANDLNEALRHFDACSIYPPTRVPALGLAGETFCKLGRPHEALGVLELALSLAPTDPQSHLWRAEALYHTGDRWQAATALEELIKLTPADYRPHKLLAQIHEDEKEWGRAENDLLRCLKKSPPAPVRQKALIELARVRLQLGKLNEALAVLKTAEDQPQVWACRAAIHNAARQPQLARDAAREVLKRSPQSLDGLLWMGTLEANAGHLSQAATYFERAIEHHPQDEHAPQRLASVYAKLGRTDEAQAQEDRARQIRELREKFAKLEKQAVEIPKDAAIRFDLGRTAESLKLLRLAQTWYQAALILDPNHRPAQTALSRLKKLSELSPSLSPGEGSIIAPHASPSD